MAQPFLGEIRIFSFQFAPKSWAFCNGQTLSIQQNTALFSLLGTFYGGNGTSTFALPNLQGRNPIHRGNPVGGGVYTIGQNGGETAHTLTQAETPVHLHLAQGSSTSSGLQAVPTGNVLAGAANVYAAAGSLVALAPASLTAVGGGQPHDNMQPYLTLSFCIALSGIFPSRN